MIWLRKFLNQAQAENGEMYLIPAFHSIIDICILPLQRLWYQYANVHVHKRHSSLNMPFLLKRHNWTQSITHTVLQKTA